MSKSRQAISQMLRVQLPMVLLIRGSPDGIALFTLLGSLCVLAVQSPISSFASLWLTPIPAVRSISQIHLGFSFLYHIGQLHGSAPGKFGGVRGRHEGEELDRLLRCDGNLPRLEELDDLLEQYRIAAGMA